MNMSGQIELVWIGCGPVVVFCELDNETSGRFQFLAQIHSWLFGRICVVQCIVQGHINHVFQWTVQAHVYCHTMFRMVLTLGIYVSNLNQVNLFKTS